MSRRVTRSRRTRETQVSLCLDLDGTGQSEIQTGIGFLNHQLETFARHGQFDLTLECIGDLEVDDHHTAEDCALVLGLAFDEALGNRAGIQRFGSRYAPLDEALCRAVVDLSGRPWPEVRLQLVRESIGGWATENVTHFFRSFALASRTTLHVDVLRGDNDHHKIEAAFKALALACRDAVARCGEEIPSTKGVL